MLNFLSSSSSSASSALPSSCPWVSSAPWPAALADICLLAEGSAFNENMHSQLDAFPHMAIYEANILQNHLLQGSGLSCATGEEEEESMQLVITWGSVLVFLLLRILILILFF